MVNRCLLRRINGFPELPTSLSLRPPLYSRRYARGGAQEPRRKWNEALVRDMFGREDADAILAISESREGTADVLRWHFTENGEYTGKERLLVGVYLLGETEFVDPLGLGHVVERSLEACGASKD